MSIWKKTDNELPEYGEQILFIDQNGYGCFGYYNPSNNCFHEYYGNDYRVENVQGWLRIPKFDL